MRMENIHKF